MKVPLAEHFHSIQGEGHWVGTPMHFIRLAGCSVGHYLRPDTVHKEGEPPTLPTGKPAWLCHTWDRRPFWCDTDFNKKEEVELEQLLEETWEDHICITGGEPLIHTKVIEALYKEWCAYGSAKFCKATIHVETSGTILHDLPVDTFWITCSPKIGWNPEVVKAADELKLLISQDTPDEWPEEFLEHTRVFLSPINQVVNGEIDGIYDTRSTASLRRAQELLRAHPSWRLSVQLHKYLGVR